MTKHSQPWVAIEKIDAFVEIEPALVVLGFALISWLISKVFFRDISLDRRRTLDGLIKNLAYNLIFGIPLFVLYMLLERMDYEGKSLERFLSYLGLTVIFFGATVFIKATRILVFEYLYLSHMRVAFPVLLVNLFTLLLSLILGSWIGTEIFNIRLAPILATSAIFSLVLGLALQDTLGNLFAGVALQFDKPYGIGDWIEIQSDGHKWVGQVSEVSWRATVLISFTEELITVPNRVMSQAQISNFSSKYRPIIRTLVFRLSFDADVDTVKALILDVIQSFPEVRKIPRPLVLISETTESWVGFKAVYYIDDYGIQFILADKIYMKIISSLKGAGFELAGNKLVTHLPKGIAESMIGPETSALNKG